MKILDFTKNPLTTMSFPTETIWVSCYVPKVIVFETAEEIWKFKAVCERELQPPLEDIEDEDVIDNGYEGGTTASEICGYLVNYFESESFMVEVSNDKTHEYYGNYKGRTLILTSDISECTMDDTVNISTNKLGYDVNMNMNCVEVFAREINALLASEGLDKKLKADTQDMFHRIVNVFNEDVAAWKSGIAEYFQRDIKEVRNV